MGISATLSALHFPRIDSWVVTSVGNIHNGTLQVFMTPARPAYLPTKVVDYPLSRALFILNTGVDTTRSAAANYGDLPNSALLFSQPDHQFCL